MVDALPTPWISWRDRSLDWADSGRRIQTYTDGNIVEGELTIDDVMEDSWGDEWPIWMIELPDGSEVSIADCEFYRFLTPRISLWRSPWE